MGHILFLELKEGTYNLIEVSKHAGATSSIKSASLKDGVEALARVYKYRGSMRVRIPAQSHYPLSSQIPPRHLDTELTRCRLRLLQRRCNTVRLACVLIVNFMPKRMCCSASRSLRTEGIEDYSWVHALWPQALLELNPRRRGVYRTNQICMGVHGDVELLRYSSVTL